MSELEGEASGPPVYVVSGGVGQCGKQVVDTVLAQFADVRLPVVTRAHVRSAKQVQAIVRQAREAGAIVVHTLVAGRLRRALVEAARRAQVTEIDLFGALMGRIEQLTGVAPTGRPGLYHQLRRDYFERVAAVEFAMATDDGMGLRQWAGADMLLVGPSRVGKTPLSMYLAGMGWKVANLPLVLDIPVPDELFRLDPRRVFGLLLSPERALEHRRERRRSLPHGCDAYADPSRIAKEMDYTRRICRRGRFTVRDVTGIPVETTSRQLLELLHERFGELARTAPMRRGGPGVARAS